MNVWGKLALFAGGTLFGSAGVSILGSRDAKKLYAHATATVLRGKDGIMRCVETLQENCSDILADAKAINEARAADAEPEVVGEDAGAAAGDAVGNAAGGAVGDAAGARVEA